MSNSYKKNPIIGAASIKSEKEDKQDANRKFRRIVKSQIKVNNFDFPLIREVSNVWCFEKDGKHFLDKEKQKALKKYLRK